MIVSTKGRYALRVMVNFAGRPQGEYIPLKAISEEEIDHILKSVPEVVSYLRGMSPVWRDLQTGKRQYIL